jgi:L-gulonolactone oxidase
MSARRTNFGHNVAIEPRTVIVPTTEADILTCLQTYRDRQIRVLGSLHSWSEAAQTTDIALDLRHFNQIEVCTDPVTGEMCVEVGAGCSVEQVLDYLGRDGRYTLPVFGVIGKQTVAGAISTATHGSGESSMSHYVVAASIAAYDRDFNARVIRCETGLELAAVRCGLGCTGVLLSVRLRIVPDFKIEERGQWFDKLDTLLAEGRTYPRTQFYLMPWTWRFYAQLRRPIVPRRSRVPAVRALVLRVFRLAMIDVLLNGVIRYLAATPRRGQHLPWVFRRAMPLLAMPGIRVVDDSRRLLTMRHDLFMHVECEIFVPAEKLLEAATFVEWALRCCAGEELPASTDDVAAWFGGDVIAGIEPLRGAYRHHYPITFRRVLRDGALISMTSGDDEEWYAISLITYENELMPFLRLSRVVAKTLATTLGARPHWGKICPLRTTEIATLYPRMAEFRAFCASIDPAQVFVNDFARRMVGFDPAARRVPPQIVKRSQTAR